MTTQELCELAREIGFDHYGPLDPKTIRLKKEVRDMCASGTCTVYNTRWSCPPGCGPLEEWQERIGQYSGGVLVQSVAEMEDAFDAESMMEAAVRHGQQFLAMQEKLMSLGSEILPIGTGSCSVCKTCTYPDAPCRFPERKVSSMEALGMLVSEVCQDNGITYYYGPNTVAYSSCFLLK